MKSQLRQKSASSLFVQQTSSRSFSKNKTHKLRGKNNVETSWKSQTGFYFHSRNWKEVTRDQGHAPVTRNYFRGEFAAAWLYNHGPVFFILSNMAVVIK